MTTDRIPPQSLDAERSLIASIMLDSDNVDEVTPIVSEESFYGDAHQLIFAACVDLHRRGKRIDPLIVGEHLQSLSQLGEIGGYDYLTDLVEFVPHSAHAVYYAEIVREHWAHRKVIYACSGALRTAYEPSSDVREIVSSVHRELTQLDDELAGRDRHSSAMADLLIDVAREIETGTSHGLRTGFHGLDDITNGLRPGNLVVLAARPSCGKTAMCANIAKNVARSGKRVLLFSVEQKATELAQRLLCAEARMPMHKLRGDILTETERATVMEACNSLSLLPLDIEDSNGWTVPQMAACARIHARQKPVDLIIVDYLQIVSPDRQRDPREQQVAQMSRDLKRLGNDVDCPVLVLAQLNREIEKAGARKPRLSDLRESGSIEQNADQVWFIHRPADFDPSLDPTESYVIVAKNRNGRRGEAPMYWTAETMEFVDGPQGRYDVF